MRIAPRSLSQSASPSQSPAQSWRHRSPHRSLLWYSQSDVIALLEKLDAMGLSKAELDGMLDWTLEAIDKLVNTVKADTDTEPQ